MDKKIPEMKPLAPMDMHAPIEVTVAVRMVMADGSTGRMMYEMHQGVFPTRAAIQEAVAEALAMTGEVRPMNKPEFVAHITTRATGGPVPMAGDQHFVPAPPEIPHGVLVHAIMGAPMSSMMEGEYEARGLGRYIGLGDDYEFEWGADKLAELPDAMLMAIYQRLVAA